MFAPAFRILLYMSWLRFVQRRGVAISTSMEEIWDHKLSCSEHPATHQGSFYAMSKNMCRVDDSVGPTSTVETINQMLMWY